MGKGAGIKFDINFAMRLVAMVACAVSLGIMVSVPIKMREDFYLPLRVDIVSNTYIYAAGAYLIIITLFFYGYIKDGPDKTLTAIVLLCGALWCVGGGGGVIAYKSDYDATVTKYQFYAAILEITAGLLLLLDSLRVFLEWF